MHIKRYKENISIFKIRVRINGGVDMATISFERDIKLSPKAIQNLVKVSNQPVKNMTRTTNAIESLHKGEQILNRLFSR
jgi:hypothetical protein